MPDFWSPNSGIEPQARPIVENIILKYVSSLYIVPFIYSNFQSTKPQYNIACILSRMAANAFRFRRTAKKLYTTLFLTFKN